MSARIRDYLNEYVIHDTVLMEDFDSTDAVQNSESFLATAFMQMYEQDRIREDPEEYPDDPVTKLRERLEADGTAVEAIYYTDDLRAWIADLFGLGNPKLYESGDTIEMLSVHFEEEDGLAWIDWSARYQPLAPQIISITQTSDGYICEA